MDIHFRILENLPTPLGKENPLIPHKHRATFDRPDGLFQENKDDTLRVYQLYHEDPEMDLQWKLDYYRAWHYLLYGHDAVRVGKDGAEDPTPVDRLSTYRLLCLWYIQMTQPRPAGFRSPGV